MSAGPRRGRARRLLVVGLSSCVALLAYAAPGALAADYCVNSPECHAADQWPDLQSALNAAGFHAGDDRVFAGPGTHTAANGFSYDAAGDSGRVELIGAGREATKLVSTAPNSTTLALTGGKVRNLAIEAPQGATGIVALALDAALADDLSVVGGDSGVSLAHAAALEDSQVTADNLGVRTVGLGFVIRSTIKSSGLAIYDSKGDIFVFNSSLSGVGGVTTQGNATIKDTLIRLKPGDASTGELVGGIAAYSDAGTPRFVSATNVTVVGDGQPGEFTALAQAQNAGSQITLRVENIIGAGTPNRFYRRALSGGLATIVAAHSNLPAEPDRDDGGAGSINTSQDNFSVDPKFVDPAGDFHLASNSPLIDHGTTNPQGGLSHTDLEGNPRAADGDGDGTVVPDMGAFERPAPGSEPAPAPSGGSAGSPAGDSAASDSPGESTPAGAGSTGADPAPVLSRLALAPRRFAPGARSARRGAFRFTLSEPARVRIKIQRLTSARKRTVGRIARNRPAGSSRLAFSGRVRHRQLKPGRYLATVVAIDAAGQRSAARRVRFTVTGR